MTNERSRTLLRISFGVVMLLVGVVVALLYDGATSPVGVQGPDGAGRPTTLSVPQDSQFVLGREATASR